jgi:nucleotidyltransferase/DNA polymerase involved in DNA repair
MPTIWRGATAGSRVKRHLDLHRNRDQIVHYHFSVIKKWKNRIFSVLATMKQPLIFILSLDQCYTPVSLSDHGPSVLLASPLGC